MVRDTDKIHKYLELKPAGGLGYGARSETGLVRFTLRCLLIASTKFSVLRGACIWLVLILAILQVGCLSEIHVYSR